jgi:hypothetical protein
MVNKEKRKGTDWEKQVAELFNNSLNIKWKRVPGSGALGTILENSALRGDVRGRFLFSSRPVLIEAKTGYGGSKQLTIKKEWLDKIKDEADTVFGIPILACKFLNARSGVKHFIVMDIDSFLDLMSCAEDLQEIIDDYYDKEKENVSNK